MAAFAWKGGHTIAAVVVGALIVASGISAGVLLTRADRSSSPSGTGSSVRPSTGPSAGPASPSPKPRAPVDPLTGGRLSDNPVIAVKVENTYPARPQVGLAAADIVTVEEVEGGLTRLIAIYHTAFPERVGPVRSARNTDVEYLAMFGRPGLVYSGANGRVQANIERSPIVALPRSTRDNRRQAPHNVFVDLDAIEASKKLRAATSIGWTFGDADDWAGAKQKKSVATSVGGDVFSFGYSGGGYTVRWKGQRYADGDSGRIASTDNVVVLSVHNRPDGNRDVNGASSVKSDTVGRGKVTIYSQGRVRSGTWVRTKESGPMRFVDADGADISLVKGKTWLLLRG